MKLNQQGWRFFVALMSAILIAITPAFASDSAVAPCQHGSDPVIPNDPAPIIPVSPGPLPYYAYPEDESVALAALKGAWEGFKDGAFMVGAVTMVPFDDDAWDHAKETAAKYGTTGSIALAAGTAGVASAYALAAYGLYGLSSAASALSNSGSAMLSASALNSIGISSSSGAVVFTTGNGAIAIIDGAIVIASGALSALAGAGGLMVFAKGTSGFSWGDPVRDAFDKLSDRLASDTLDLTVNNGRNNFRLNSNGEFQFGEFLRYTKGKSITPDDYAKLLAKNEEGRNLLNQYLQQFFDSLSKADKAEYFTDMGRIGGVGLGCGH